MKEQGKEQGLQRYRDIVMQTKSGETLILLAIENQEEIHYAMPIRSMLYDALNYSEQVSIISKEKRKYKKLHGSAEFLSGFRKTDKVSPVITLVFYYGSKEWDGSQDVYGLIDLERTGMEETDVELLKKYIPNYKVNLIQAVDLAENNSFKTDLQWMMGMLRYKENKTELIQYMNDHVDFFGNINKDEFSAVKVLLGSKNIPKVLSQTEGKRRDRYV